jgi:hypothetical protein
MADDNATREAQAAERRIALAREALDVNPDCADAYILELREALETPGICCR